jgi:hypothetical protein
LHFCLERTLMHGAIEREKVFKKNVAARPCKKIWTLAENILGEELPSHFQATPGCFLCNPQTEWR